VLLAQLRERKILVRHFTQQRIANHLRITVGTQQECETLVAALQQLVVKDHASHTKVSA
jgi:histidinol-phosphate aminotransferase